MNPLFNLTFLLFAAVACGHPSNNTGPSPAEDGKLDHNTGEPSDGNLCLRGMTCSTCLGTQPEGALCKTRWEECQASSACADALPPLFECLCTATTKEERLSCLGPFQASETTGVAFNLAYCVGIDACLAQCLEDDAGVAVPMDMVDVPAGTFMMGCNGSADSDCRGDEDPQHEVHLDAYRMDRTEVTQAVYDECVSAGVCTAVATQNCASEDCGQFPLSGVTWTQASDYCDWRGKRLPSEAEWEKAARGTDGRIFPWGNVSASCDTAAIAVEGSNEGTCITGAPVEVATKPNDRSPYGVLDMAGNVSEWVSDWYDSTFYATSPFANPHGPTSGTTKVFRGGTWYWGADSARTSRRRELTPTLGQFLIVGIRCAASAE